MEQQPGICSILTVYEWLHREAEASTSETRACFTSRRMVHLSGFGNIVLACVASISLFQNHRSVSICQVPMWLISTSLLTCKAAVPFLNSAPSSIFISVQDLTRVNSLPHISDHGECFQFHFHLSIMFSIKLAQCGIIN